MKKFPVYLRSMSIETPVFNYTVCFRTSLAKGPRYTVSRLCTQEQVANAGTLFYGSTAAAVSGREVKVRHLTTVSHDEFVSWLGKCIGKRAAHNACTLLYGPATETDGQDDTDAQ